MTDIEILAQEVLEMMSLQEDYEKISRARLYKKVDGETHVKAHFQKLDAERKVQEMCKDVLGIEED